MKFHLDWSIQGYIISSGTFRFPIPIPISESGVPCESLPPEIYKLCFLQIQVQIVAVLENNMNNILLFHLSISLLLEFLKHF